MEHLTFAVVGKDISTKNLQLV